MSQEVSSEKKKSRVKGRKALWIAIVSILVWLSIGGFAGGAFSKISSVQENDNSAFLPDSAESTIAGEVLVKFSSQEDQLFPALLLLLGDLNPATNAQAFEKVSQYSAGLLSKTLPETGKPLSTYFAQGVPLTPIPSTDGKAILINAQLDFAVADANVDGEPIFPKIIEFIRTDMEKEFTAAGITTHVTGPAGLFADLFEAFGSIDTRLLQTTLIVVAIILIVVYRSPVLWILPLFTAASALGIATTVVYYLAKENIIDLNGQTQGILDVLVLGAATDYALLLIARYREELHHHHSRFDAMKIALRGVIEPIIASGSTVIAGLMVLLLSDLSSNRGLGPVGSIGIASSMLAVLTLLPALLILFGRWIFWPKIPRFGQEDEKLSGIWSKVGKLVDRRPKAVWVSTAVVLLIFAGFSTTLKSDGLSQSEAFTTRTDSVIGLEKLGEHFPSGEGTPVEIVVDQKDIASAAAAIGRVSNVASVVPLTNVDPLTQRPTSELKVVDGKVVLYATLKVAPDSAEGKASIPLIRQAAKAVNPNILVGGQSAIGYDVDQSSRRDNRVIIPIVLLLIAVILGFLLRSILAAALLLGTVVLSFAATLGVCALVFDHVFGFAGTDASFPLFAFIFLVALGIDYNIFLMTRVREESLKIGTRAGIIKGLTVTGGVITSAGIVLAATFGVLGILPLVFLAELGFAVAFGVLLDTIIVRSLLVPALVRVIGPKIWWPSKLQNQEN
ncbi:MAG: MMPL family transporter [Actinobacteria bacterium]|nr:MMPL family transporter [Actinomycetota bacterium]NBO06752.1 MMPL family transporter [Actinomycetota bacterium]NBO47468.1 MMPL family transporter [Actinomycetota bacterium]NBP12230.1 MMPL family transporter [Actinomycetota bacterium]NBP21802.1 MMPL family transporter [Actinomycetota bacterium]